MGFDEEAHAKTRRAFANSFSDKSLRDQAPVIEGYLDMFMNQMKAPASGTQFKEKVIDLNTWYNFLTFDISGDLSFGESFDCLKTGKAHPWVEIAQDFGKGLSLVASVNQYPPIDKLLRYIIPKNIRQRQIDHRSMSYAKAKKRLALGVERPDFVTPTKKYSDEKVPLSEAEWEINMMIIVFAGSETTASSLTAITRELVQHRGAMHRLTREIRGAFKTEHDITIATTGSLTYLNAVINETLRLDPPTTIGVPRVVPRGGDTVCGQWVPGGVSTLPRRYPLLTDVADIRSLQSVCSEPSTSQLPSSQLLHTRTLPEPGP
jgi:cytochrome P450